jgi:hypothetical protein
MQGNASRLAVGSQELGLIFVQRVEADGKWSLFCPNEAPGLAESWGADFTVRFDVSHPAASPGRRFAMQM